MIFIKSKKRFKLQKKVNDANDPSVFVQPSDPLTKKFAQFNKPMIKKQAEKMKPPYKKPQKTRSIWITYGF